MQSRALLSAPPPATAARAAWPSSSRLAGTRLDARERDEQGARAVPAPQEGGSRPRWSASSGPCACSTPSRRRARSSSPVISPADVQQRLRSQSSRFRGAARSRSAASRYRRPTASSIRQIGLDPDVQRTPIEEAVLERMLRGAFPSGGLLADVLLIAMLDTSVARLGAGHRGGRRRAGYPRERRGRGARALRAMRARCPPASLVVADCRARSRSCSGRSPPASSTRGAQPADPVRGPGRGRAEPVRGGGAVVRSAALHRREGLAGCIGAAGAGRIASLRS